MRLKRELSKLSLLLISIGSIVGSGWLFGSFYTAQIAGPAAILSWFIGGVFIAFIALNLAELSTMLPVAGGSTVFVTITHGKFAGSIFSWITWLWSLVVAPIEAQAILQYCSNYIPNIFYPNTNILSHTGIIYATVLMLLLSGVNMIGVKFMANFNNFIVYWKLIIPLAIVLVLLFYKPHVTNLWSANGFMPNGFSSVFSAISNGGIALSYFGFQTAIFLAGEAKKPQKTIPFALFGSLLACITLYVLLQVGFILSLDPKVLKGGWSTISFVGDAGPFAGIFLAFGLTFMIGLLYFDAIISPFGTGISYVASASRILYSMALQGDAPKGVAKINRFSVPWVAILINFVIGMLFFLPFSGWQEMASFISAAVVFTLAAGPICLPIFRKNYSDLERPFYLKFAPVIAFVSFYLCNLILHWTGWHTVSKLETILLIGAIVQFILHAYRQKNLNFDFVSKSWLWIPLYLFCAGIISYYGAYGNGKNIIKPGPDFFVILIYSVVVYFVAQKFCLPFQKSHQLYEKILENHTARRKTVIEV